MNTIELSSTESNVNESPRQTIGSTEVHVFDRSSDGDLRGHSLQNNGISNSATSQEQAPKVSSHRQPRNNKHAARNYMLFNLILFLLTVSCPCTSLWNNAISLCIQHHAFNVTVSGVDAPYNKNCDQITINDGPLAIMYGSINILEVSKFMLYFIAVNACFFSVYHSNPGILNEEAMEALNELDKYDDYINKRTIYSTEDPENKELIHESELDGMERQSFLEPPSELESPLHSNIPQPKPRSQLKDKQLVTTLCQSTRRKFCTKCNIYPPLRSHHCIGERNHFRFWLFLLFNVIGLNHSLQIVTSGHIPKSVDVDSIRSVGRLILVVTRFYLYPILSVATILFAIHTLLMITNSTSFEFGKASGHIDYLRGTRMMDFPFGLGLCNNLRVFFRRDDVSKQVTCAHSEELSAKWSPTVWRMPKSIERDSEDWWNHPWQNKYWSCC
eukprot:scaffold28052_cov68-Cyclotella_meneghiniana.AAC.2